MEMKYSVVYTSPTGNTQQLAQEIRAALPQEDCCYFGAPDAQAMQAELVFVGFWTDKGSCDAKTAEFLQQLQGKKVFLFGTAGFGMDQAYFDRILGNVKQNLPQEHELVGSYMCQGKMPMAVRKRYESMQDLPNRDMLIENFDRALTHPDANDLQGMQQAAQAAYQG